MDPVTTGAPNLSPPRRGRWWTLSLAVAGVASVSVAVARVWQITWYRLQLDISVYLMGAHHLTDGRLYVTELPVYPHLPFTYPPFAAVAFWPLTILPMQWAQMLWDLGNLAALFGVIAVTLRAVRPGGDRARVLLWSAVLLGPALALEPVWLSFTYGQINLLLALLILADLTGAAHIGGHRLPRGVLVGLAAAVKLVPLVFVAYLLVTRQTRAALTALGTFVGCTLVATAIDPSVSWSYWHTYATDANRVGDIHFISNQSLWAVADRIFHRNVPGALTVAASAVVLVAGIALARWAWASSSSFLGILVAATTGCLVSPITWAHHLVWVVPVLLWLVWAPDRPAGGRLWALVGAGVFWWGPIWTVPAGADHELTLHGWNLLAANAYFCALVAFLVGTAAMLAVRRRAGRMRRAMEGDDRPDAGLSAVAPPRAVRSAAPTTS